MDLEWQKVILQQFVPMHNFSSHVVARLILSRIAELFFNDFTISNNIFTISSFVLKETVSLRDNIHFHFTSNTAKFEPDIQMVYS